MTTDTTVPSFFFQGASPPEPETPDEETAVAMALRLMLHVRQTYQSIFDRLI